MRLRVCRLVFLSDLRCCTQKQNVAVRVGRPLGDGVPVSVGAHVRWVGVSRQHVACIYFSTLPVSRSSFIHAADSNGLFDNGLNRQMPGRHLAIDHGSERCCHSPPLPSRRAVFNHLPVPHCCDPFIAPFQPSLLHLDAKNNDCTNNISWWEIYWISRDYSQVALHLNLVNCGLQ